MRPAASHVKFHGPRKYFHRMEVKFINSIFEKSTSKKRFSPSFWVKNKTDQYFKVNLCIQTVWITNSNWPSQFLPSLRLASLQKNMHIPSLFTDTYTPLMLGRSRRNLFFLSGFIVVRLWWSKDKHTRMLYKKIFHRT